MDRRFARFENALKESIEVKQQLNTNLKEKLFQVVDALVESQQNGKQVIIMGNGGSAADAQHFAAEMVGRFLLERKPLNARALTTNSSVVTGLVNDYPPDLVFARQIQAHTQSGDVVVGISTSGNSANVINGLMEARKIGALSVGLTGQGGGKLSAHCDILLDVPSRSTPRIQESHIFLIHMICEFVEVAFADQNGSHG